MGLSIVLVPHMNRTVLNSKRKYSSNIQLLIGVLKARVWHLFTSFRWYKNMAKISGYDITFTHTHTQTYFQKLRKTITSIELLEKFEEKVLKLSESLEPL